MKILNWFLLLLFVGCSPRLHPVDFVNNQHIKLMKNVIEETSTLSCFETFDYCKLGGSLDDFCYLENPYKDAYGSCRNEWDWNDKNLSRILKIERKEKCGTLIEIRSEDTNPIYFLYDLQDYLIGIVVLDKTTNCPRQLYGTLVKCCL